MVQEPTIPNDVNSLDSTNMRLDKFSKREEILGNNDPTAAIQYPSHNVTFKQYVIETEKDKGVYMNSPTPLLKMKSGTN